MKPKTLYILFFLILILILAACAQGTTELKPPDIRYGEDVCVDCNMIISDPRFAAAYAYEVSAGRYESARFDDIADMLIYAGKHPDHKIAAWYVHDYETKEWIDAAAASYVASGQIETPMASGLVAFARRDRADAMAYALHAEIMDWSALQERFAAGEVGVGMAGSMAMHSDAPGQEVVLGEAEVQGVALRVAAAEPLHTGYNAIMVHAMTADGQPLTGAQIVYQPMMDMVDGRDHSAAVETPVEEAPGMYHGAVAFPMPSGPDLGVWALTIGVTHTLSSVSGEALVPIEVAPAKWSGSFVAPDESKIFVMAVQPTSQPRVGKQPFEVYVMTKQGMMSWPPLDDLTLEITPEMPTMGHGSPGNVNPTPQGSGHYLGEVNFTMSGPWTVTVVAKRGDEVLGQVVLEYAVP